ncbi:MAG: MFS transporter, partial [Legionellales bacterium]
AVIGMTIGTSFSLAMVLGPAIAYRFGLAGIFYLTAALAVLGIIILYLVIPNPLKERFHADSEAKSSLFKSVLANPHLQRLDIGIFCQHFMLTATFFAIPMILREQVNLGHLSEQWHFYLPLLVTSFILMVPCIILAEKKRLMKPIFLLSVLVTSIAQFLLAFYNLNWLDLCLLMFIYFVAFNILEASLPSLISKQANPRHKGTAMGIYSSGQFLGIFAGGSCAGIIYQWQGSKGIFVVNALIASLWFMIALYMKPDVYLSTLIVPYPSSAEKEEALIRDLLKLDGIKEVAISREEAVLYLHIDKALYKTGCAEALITLHRQNTQ